MEAARSQSNDGSASGSDQEIIDDNTIDPVKSGEQNSITVIQDQVSLNEITAMQMVQTSGIDKQLAFRIIKFRNKLGGFYHVNQLRQVYGMTEEAYNAIRAVISYHDLRIKQININHDSREVLVNHPYISEKLADQIVNFRSKFKPFGSRSDVKSLYLIDDDLYNKLIPYLKI